jgi:hypothetical protein
VLQSAYNDGPAAKSEQHGLYKEENIPDGQVDQAQGVGEVGYGVCIHCEMSSAGPRPRQDISYTHARSSIGEPFRSPREFQPTGSFSIKKEVSSLTHKEFDVN